MDQIGKGKGDIPLQRKGSTGHFKHTEVNDQSITDWYNIENLSSDGKKKKCKHNRPLTLGTYVKTNNINLHKQSLFKKYPFIYGIHFSDVPMDKW